MKLNLWIMLALFVMVTACKDNDDGDDGNQTTSEDIEVVVQIKIGDDTVDDMEVTVATGGKTGSGVTVSSVEQNKVFGVTIYDGDPQGMYTVGSGGSAEATVSYSNTDPQDPKSYSGTGGTVEVSRFEKVGENDSHHFYEMDCTVDAMMQDHQTAVVYTLEAMIKNAFIAEMK